MKISVCLATYNGEKYIKEQLDSILIQLGENDEVIISDDCSTDKTIDIIKSLDDERIIVYPNRINVGYTKNFENAIANARGDIIFLSDQDDVWSINKIEKMSKDLQNADFVVSDAEIVDKNLSLLHISHFMMYNVRKGFLNNLLKTRYIGACMAFKREILSKALPFPTNSHLCQHDYWIANIAEFYFTTYLECTPLIKYRRHDNNASTGGAYSKNSIIKKLRIRLYLLRELLKRRKYKNERFITYI
jgi:glycosyltransferase involved in cell wall biosynthesis